MEFAPEFVAESRRLFSQNRENRKAEVINADAFAYLLPEPVEVLICQMISVEIGGGVYRVPFRNSVRFTPQTA